jgi:hypothetical protein
MITISGTTQHQSAAVGVAWLVEMAFTSGTLRKTTAPLDLVTLGYTWQGLGDLASVEGVAESADAGAEQLKLTLSVVSAAMLAAAIGDPATYRGRNVKLYLALLDETWAVVGTPVARWAGVMNKMSIVRESGGSSEEGAALGRIELQCMRRGIDRSRNYEGLRLSHQQQTTRFSGDNGLEYVRTLIEKPTMWLSKDFQKR